MIEAGIICCKGLSKMGILIIYGQEYLPFNWIDPLPFPLEWGQGTVAIMHHLAKLPNLIDQKLS